MRIVVIGAGAGGVAAATRAKRVALWHPLYVAARAYCKEGRETRMGASL